MYRYFAKGAMIVDNIFSRSVTARKKGTGIVACVPVSFFGVFLESPTKF